VDPFVGPIELGDRSTQFLDSRPGCVRERVRMDDDRPSQLATGEDLDWELETPSDALGEKHLRRDWTLDLDRLEATKIDHFPRRPVDICEATLVRHSLLDRQLPTLESTPHSRAASRLLALGSSAGGLSFAASVTSAHTLAFSVRPLSAV